jgi:hypothetical protein
LREGFATSVQPVSGPADQLQRAAEVLSKNWILALPTAIASLVLGMILVLGVVSVATATFVGRQAGGGAGMWAGLGSSAIIAAVLAFAGFLLVIFSQAIVIHASEDAWEGRPVNLGASLAATVSRLPDLIVAYIISALILLVAIMLCAVVIGFPLVFVAIYFLMYVVPAVVIGRESGTTAISTSFRLASHNVGPSLIAFAGIVGASIVAFILTGITSHIPLINFIVSFAIGGLAAAYTALVSDRFYDLLRGTVPLVTATPTGSAPPPPPPDSGPPTVIR